MTPELKAAIERVRHHVMTPEETFEQRVSFVYGNQDFDSGEPMSKDEVREHLLKTFGRPVVREKIVAAAIRVEVVGELAAKIFNGEKVYPQYLTISAPPPARHGSLLHPLFDLTKHTYGPGHQGFLTSFGRYVGREEALQIALKSGQPMIDHPSRHETQLFSEDLW